MKLYATKSFLGTHNYTTFASSGDGASKDRTRLKKEGHSNIKTEQHDVDTTRTGLIEFLNTQFSSPAV